MRNQLFSTLLFLTQPFLQAGAVPAFVEHRSADIASSPAVGDDASHYGTQVEVIYEFPKPTWVESLVVRPSGLILASLLSKSEVWQVDPWLKTAQLVATFPGYNGLLGITAGADDTYYCVSTNWNQQTLNVTANQFAIWSVKMTSPTGTGATVKKVTELNQGLFLNGMETLSTNPPQVLVADSRAGVVFRVDVNSGTYTTVLNNALLKPTSLTSGLGVNGIKYDGSKYLYFSNTALALLGRVPINSDGTAAGAYETLTTNAPIDDFVLRQGGGAYLCLDQINEFGAVGPQYGNENILVNSTGSTELLGPTAVQFGRTLWDSNAVYVSTSGGLQQWATKNFLVGGRISRIWVGNWGW